MPDKKNKVKYTETIRALIFVTLFLTLAILVLGLIMVRQSNEQMKYHIDARLLDITETSSDMIAGDVYQTFTKDSIGTPEYQEIYDMLAHFQSNIDLEFIYCIDIHDDGTFTFSIDPAPVDAAEYGQQVKVTDALINASKGISDVDDEPYQDEWGRFYSAYSPIFNSNNKVVGVVACDFSAEYYDRQFRKNVRIIIAGLICSFLIGIAIIAIYSIKIKKREEQDKYNIQAAKMISALASDYWSVYYVDLDKDKGICYNAHEKINDGLKKGQDFKYSDTFRDYAERYVTEDFRQGFLDFISPDSVRANLEHEAIIAYRYLVHRHGQDSYEMLRMAGVRRPEDRDDHIVHSVGVGFSDVDQETRHTLEQRQALIDALKIAEEANMAKTRFLSNMSHEIRTPMNAIIGFNRLALEEEGVPENVREYLSSIKSSAEHLLGIINDILDMSRIESGKLIIKNEEFSLKKLLETINVMMEGNCADKNLTYSCDSSGDIGDYYMGDDVRLREILINILSNSVKYTNEGGRIDFTVKRTAMYGNKATVMFVVADNGIGMDKEFLPKIFESFTQEDVNHINKFGSTGLGMAITKNLVDIMNGKIRIESEKGVGTTTFITLTFEIADHREEALDQAKELSADSGDFSFKGKKILIAEDMDINARILLKILEQKEIQADRAENGQKAVELFEASALGYYDAILMDMRMPVMDGLEASSAIRALQREDAGKIPIIAVTANAFEEDVERSLQAGLNAHLSKPLEPLKLFETLEKLIRVYKR